MVGEIFYTDSDQDNNGDNMLVTLQSKSSLKTILISYVDITLKLQLGEIIKTYAKIEWFLYFWNIRIKIGISKYTYALVV